MPIEIKSGTVEIRIPRGNEVSISEARMLGYPVSVSGKPTLVEVLTRDGRSTLVKLSEVAPLDDAAKVLLAGRPVEHA